MYRIPKNTILGYQCLVLYQAACGRVTSLRAEFLKFGAAVSPSCLFGWLESRERSGSQWQAVTVHAIHHPASVFSLLSFFYIPGYLYVFLASCCLSLPASVHLQFVIASTPMPSLVASEFLGNCSIGCRKRRPPRPWQRTVAWLMQNGTVGILPSRDKTRQDKTRHRKKNRRPQYVQAPLALYGRHHPILQLLALSQERTLQ